MNPFSSGFPDLGAIAGIGGGGSAAAGAASFLNPWTLGLGAANIGASLFGGISSANATRDAANKIAKSQLQAARLQTAAADRAAQMQAMLGREAMKGNMAMEIGDRVAKLGYGADLDLGRQFEAQKFQRDVLAPKDIANRMFEERAMIGLKGSKEYQRLRDRESQRRIKEAIAPFAGKYAAMFGGINPINTQNLFV